MIKYHQSSSFKVHNWGHPKKAAEKAQKAAEKVLKVAFDSQKAADAASKEAQKAADEAAEKAQKVADEAQQAADVAQKAADEAFTGKSLSEAFILESTNPQYDKRFTSSVSENYKLRTCCV